MFSQVCVHMRVGGYVSSDDHQMSLAGMDVLTGIGVCPGRSWHGYVQGVISGWRG